MKIRDIDVIVGRLRRRFTDADSYDVLMTVIRCAEQLGDPTVNAASSDRLERVCSGMLTGRELVS